MEGLEDQERPSNLIVKALAARLLDLALGDAAARLWVFEENLRAQRFYAKHRFVPSGQRLLDPDTRTLGGAAGALGVKAAASGHHRSGMPAEQRLKILEAATHVPVEVLIHLEVLQIPVVIALVRLEMLAVASPLPGDAEVIEHADPDAREDCVAQWCSGTALQPRGGDPEDVGDDPPPDLALGPPSLKIRGCEACRPVRRSTEYEWNSA